MLSTDALIKYMAGVKVENELRWRKAKNSPQLVFTDRNKHVKRRGTKVCPENPRKKKFLRPTKV